MCNLDDLRLSDEFKSFLLVNLTKTLIFLFMRHLVVLMLLIFSVLQVYSQSEQALNKQIRLSLEELKAFVALPNDANSPKDIDQNLIWLVRAFKGRGFDARLLATEGLPLFYAEMSSSPEKPTILFYMHFDGQSVDPSKWEQNDPYQIVLKKSEGSRWVRCHGRRSTRG